MLEQWKERMMQDAPRLMLDSKFRFSCHKDVPCFGKCCGDVNIFLTPYDVLRMKRALQLSSGEFLEKHTISLLLKDRKYPVVALKMNDDERKSCPFVTAEGCRVYQDRPWSCRMYPIGTAPPQTKDGDEEYYLVAEEGKPCLGMREDAEWTVEGWLINQGVDSYNKKSQEYMELTLQKCFLDGEGLDEAKTRMFYTACYDIDRFRKYIFESSFCDRFDIGDDTIERIKTDDEALLEFGIRWLKFSIFGEDTIKIKDEVLEKKKKELGLSSTE